MASPVVVQGTPVQGGGFGGSLDQAPPPAASGPVIGAQQFTEKKESKCNDPLFVLLFIINLIAICGVAAAFGPNALSATNNSGSAINVNYGSYVLGCVIIGIISFFGAAGGMALLMCIPETMIKVALIFVVVMSGISCVMSWIAGQWGIAVIATIFFAITLCYACAVWSRIPFATINLVTACTAIKANLGVTIYAYLITVVSIMWVFCWTVAFIGVFDRTYVCDANNVCSNPNYGYLFLLFVAFFFGQQVFQYAIHVMVAGTVATWWYDPEECGCCSSAVTGGFCRTWTTSLGSICFGSLIVAILEALRMLARTAQQEGELQFLACIAECILACLSSIVEYMNKWAFVYVGIYGFSYIQSAKACFELFRNRGWEAIIADSLVGDTLALVSIVIGALMGAIALLMQATGQVFTSVSATSDSSANVFAFTLGFVVGLTITSILMSVIGSGVNAVLVLFAEAPADFQRNYPELSNRMRTIWAQVYPGSV